MEQVRFLSTSIEHTDTDSFVVEKEELYTVTYKTDKITRDDYILNCWNERYPNAHTTDIERVRQFISSSSKLQHWYAQIMINYQANVQMPDYLKDVLDIKEYNKLTTDLQKYNKILQQRSDAISNAAKTFKKSLNAINASHEKEAKVLLKDKLLYILTLNRSDLPLDLQQELIDFTPKDIKSPKERRERSKEIVIEYQKSLISKVKSDPDFNIRKYVEDSRDVFRESTFVG